MHGQIESCIRYRVRKGSLVVIAAAITYRSNSNYHLRESEHDRIIMDSKAAI
mgnify:CR=1 FL=1